MEAFHFVSTINIKESIVYCYKLYFRYSVMFLHLLYLKNKVGLHLHSAEVVCKPIGQIVSN